MLGHRAGVAPLGAGPGDPARLRASEYARFEEALDTGHGQLHPPYARVGAKSVEHPVHREAVPYEAVSRLAIASDHLSAALDHGLDGIIGARWREGHSQRGRHYQTGWWRRRCPQRARFSQAEVSPATADLIR